MSTTNQPPPLPVILELATLPRDQLGPFIILGVDKTAAKEQIEAAWARRLIWARKSVIQTPLEDINWAREALSDFDKRVRADAASLNLDTTEGVLRSLHERYGGKGKPGSRPLDLEKPLADYSPPIPVPDLAEVRQAIPLGEVPQEIPAAAMFLQQFLQENLDPWDESVTRIDHNETPNP